MSNYYYLAASLPYLKFGDTPPISTERFLLECEKWIKPEELSALKELDLYGRKISEGKISIIEDWKKFDEKLRAQLSAGFQEGKKAQTVHIENVVQEILEKPTPLEKEKQFEKLRWTFLEEKSTGHFFDLNVLIVYFLKLKILERFEVFNKDEGEKFFYNLCEVSYGEAKG